MSSWKPKKKTFTKAGRNTQQLYIYTSIWVPRDGNKPKAKITHLIYCRNLNELRLGYFMQSLYPPWVCINKNVLEMLVWNNAETRVEILSLYFQSYFNVQKLFFKPEKMLAKSITFVFSTDKTYLKFFSVILLDSKYPFRLTL